MQSQVAASQLTETLFGLRERSGRSVFSLRLCRWMPEIHTVFVSPRKCVGNYLRFSPDSRLTQHTGTNSTGTPALVTWSGKRGGGGRGAELLTSEKENGGKVKIGDRSESVTFVTVTPRGPSPRHDAPREGSSLAVLLLLHLHRVYKSRSSTLKIPINLLKA